MIIHSRRPTHDFTIVRNEVIRDELLSFRARGVLLYLLSMPGDWETSSQRIADAGREGRDAVRRALQELIDVGYVTREKEQDAAGHWVTHYTVRDRPWLNPKPVDNSS